MLCACIWWCLKNVCRFFRFQILFNAISGIYQKLFEFSSNQITHTLLIRYIYLLAKLPLSIQQLSIYVNTPTNSYRTTVLHPPPSSVYASCALSGHRAAKSSHVNSVETANWPPTWPKCVHALFESVRVPTSNVVGERLYSFCWMKNYFEDTLPSRHSNLLEFSRWYAKISMQSVVAIRNYLHVHTHMFVVIIFYRLTISCLCASCTIRLRVR